MLHIHFLNDKTGDEVEGNYKWVVMINETVLAKGEIKSHNRISGWQGLVRCFAEQECQCDEKDGLKNLEEFIKRDKK